jgi:hypothetical protein
MHQMQYSHDWNGPRNLKCACRSRSTAGAEQQCRCRAQCLWHMHRHCPGQPQPHVCLPVHRQNTNSALLSAHVATMKPCTSERFSPANTCIGHLHHAMHCKHNKPHPYARMQCHVPSTSALQPNNRHSLRSKPSACTAGSARDLGVHINSHACITRRLCYKR